MALKLWSCRYRLQYLQMLAIFGLAAITFNLWRASQPHKESHVNLVPSQPLQGAFNYTKALVIAKTVSENIDWLFNSGFNESHGLFIYTMSTPPEPGYLLPRTTIGREASAFISYIIDYYDALPDHSIFIHAKDEQKHNDLFGPLTSHLLPHLRSAAIDAAGYVNLRCDTDPGCPIAVNPHDPTEEDRADDVDPRAKFVAIYSELFDVRAAEVPRHIGNVCCAQFAVSRKRILQRPKKDYERMMNWIANTTQTDTFGVGWVMEKLWHVVFGMESILCPRYQQCRCDLYGWCGPLASGEILRPLDIKEP